MIEGSDCFICADLNESPIMTNLCDCKDRKIHKICQERLMKECDMNAAHERGLFGVQDALQAC